MTFPVTWLRSARLVLALAALVALATLAAADGARPSRPRRGEPLLSCDAEIQTLCRGTRLGSGEVLACLLRRAEESSPKCRAALADAAARIAIGQRIFRCRRSMRELCPPPVKPHAILACLRRQRTKLPPQCVAQLDAELDRRRLCAPDNPPILI